MDSDKKDHQELLKSISQTVGKPIVIIKSEDSRIMQYTSSKAKEIKQVEEIPTDAIVLFKQGNEWYTADTGTSLLSLKQENVYKTRK